MYSFLNILLTKLKENASNYSYKIVILRLKSITIYINENGIKSFIFISEEE